jgi:hypothetical protein
MYARLVKDDDAGIPLGPEDKQFLREYDKERASGDFLIGPNAISSIGMSMGGGMPLGPKTTSGVGALHINEPLNKNQYPDPNKNPSGFDIRRTRGF